jgi:hypothetical protein
MLKRYLAMIFGGPVPQPGRKVRRLPATRLGVEALGDRVLPSAGCTAAAGASSAAAQAARVSSFDAGSRSASADRGDHHGGGCGAAEHASLAASLTNAAGATGTATFSESNGTLFVPVKGAAAGTTLSVAVTDNGTTTTLGSVTTDASGNGFAKFTGVTVAAGDTITVGDLTGTFAQTRFTATLAGTTTGVTGTASANALKNKLHVTVSGATANTEYTVSVNGTSVGSFTTNAAGRGRLRVTPSGVTIATGSTITIADADGNTLLSGTFA